MQEPFIIIADEETPSIILDKQNEKFIFSGTSWLANAYTFYEPVIDWVKEYFDNTPNPITVLKFEFSYINTASAKQIARILSILKKYSLKNNIKIQWYYEKEDLDMKKEGQRFASILDLKIDIIEK